MKKLLQRFLQYIISYLPSARQKEYAWIIFKDWCKQKYSYWFDPQEKTPFTGKFLPPVEQAKLLLRNNNGVFINGRLRLNEERSTRHALILGGTGSGKSSNVYLPSLLELENPMIVLDASGDLFRKTSGHLENKGFQVLRLNFSDPLRSEGYNPMHRANTDGQMKRLAATLINTALPKSDDSYWPQAAEQVLYTIIRILKESAPPEHQNLANVLHILNNLSHKNDTPGYVWILANASPAAFNSFKGAMAGTENTINAVLACCRTALQKISDSEIARLTSTDTLGELKRLRTKKCVLYLSLKETDIKYLSFIVSLVITELLDMAMEMPDENTPTLYFLLDEFGHFFVDSYTNSLTTLRKRNVSVIMSAQSKSMLVSKYGAADAETIMSGGVATTFILPGQNDARANQELSTLLGNRIVEYKDKPMVRPLLSPDEIFALDNQGIFMHAGHRATLLPLYPAHLNPRLEGFTKLPPVSYLKKALPEVAFLDLSNKQSKYDIF